MGDHLKPQAVYDQLWQQASAALQRGQPDVDPFLQNRENDLRRAVTLVFRPSPTVRQNVETFLQQARQIAAGQYFYRPEELHTTALSVIPGSVDWQQRWPELPKLRAIIAGSVQGRKAFTVAYRGVTASTGAVMIQGFPADDTLARLRDDLRAAFHQNNLGADIDHRYKISAAHITAIRFAASDADWNGLSKLLRANRTTDFGETRVENLELIFGDWYASRETVQVLETYSLRAAQ